MSPAALAGSRLCGPTFVGLQTLAARKLSGLGPRSGTETGATPFPAPCVAQDDAQADTEECPICLLHYPAVNETDCCHKALCTECFLQARPRTGQSGPAGPLLPLWRGLHAAAGRRAGLLV